MTQSPAKPKPVQVGRYRYSKLRWRLLVRALDLLGTIVLAIVRRFRPVRRLTCPRRVLVVQLDHLGDAVNRFLQAIHERLHALFFNQRGGGHAIIVGKELRHGRLIDLFPVNLRQIRQEGRALCSVGLGWFTDPVA